MCFAFFWRIHSAHLGFGDFTAANPIYREARTMVQVGIVVSQFFNSLTVRSDDQSILTIGIFTNRKLMLVSFGLALLLADEGRKLIVRRRRSQPPVAAGRSLPSARPGK